MKKRLLALVLAGLIMAPMVLAGATPTSTTPPNIDIINNALPDILNWAFGILLFLAALFIIVGGYYWVTAGGDAAKVGTARNFLIYALIGVAVAFLARGLISLVNTVVN